MTVVDDIKAKLNDMSDKHNLNKAWAEGYVCALQYHNILSDDEFNELIDWIIKSD